MVAMWGEPTEVGTYTEHVVRPRPAGALGQRGARADDPCAARRRGARAAVGGTTAAPAPGPRRPAGPPGGPARPRARTGSVEGEAHAKTDATRGAEGAP